MNVENQNEYHLPISNFRIIQHRECVREETRSLCPLPYFG